MSDEKTNKEEVLTTVSEMKLETDSKKIGDIFATVYKQLRDKGLSEKVAISIMTAIIGVMYKIESKEKHNPRIWPWAKDRILDLIIAVPIATVLTYLINTLL